LAFDGITSLSVKPIRLITSFGVVVALVSAVGIIFSMVKTLIGGTFADWAPLSGILCFLNGIQLIGLGIIGEYIGKIYLETKKRPRFIISQRTDEEL